jgi:Sir2 family
MVPKPSKKARFDPTSAPFRLCSKKGTFDEAFESVSKILQGRKNVLVLAGAGISVSCGIPDFRSKDKGLYSTMDFHVSHRTHKTGEQTLGIGTQ